MWKIYSKDDFVPCLNNTCVLPNSILDTCLFTLWFDLKVFFYALNKAETYFMIFDTATMLHFIADNRMTM